MFFIKNIFFSVFFLSSILLSQGLVINEIVTSNQSGLVDDFGKTSDWIELFNNSDQETNLNDFYLSDKPTNLLKSKLPNIVVGPNEHLLIFASGEENFNNASGWETKITSGDIWKYFPGNTEPSSDWNSISFNDINWQSGKTGIGYGDGDDITTINSVPSVYLRKKFVIDNIENIVNAFLSIDFDDGFVAYLNGYEIARINLGEVGEHIPYNSFANEPLEARLYNGEKLDAIFLENIKKKIIQGENLLAIQVHNADANSSDLTAIPFFTVGYESSSESNFIAEEVEHLIPNIHANFNISNGNEGLYLSNSAGIILDSIPPIELPIDVSYGRAPDGSDNWLFLEYPTPGLENTINGYTQKIELPELNFEAGFYNSSFIVELTNNFDFETYYTLDGSIPNQNSARFENLLSIENNTLLKIKSFGPNSIPSLTNTYSYFIDEQINLPVVALSTDPTNLWDYNTGIYVHGPNGDSNFPYFNANFWQDWEKPGTIELFDKNKNRQFHSDVMIKIFGGWSRAYSQRSISVFGAAGVSDGEFNYRLFSQLTNNNFKSFVLRNSGNDWNSTMLRDGFMQSLANDLNLDHLAYEPAILFLNGEYWGIHNIREKINLNYINSHYDVDKDSVDLLQLNGEIIDGDNKDYFEMTDFLNANSLTSTNNYEYIKSKIDIDSYIDYYCTQIFIANTDWPGNNNKFWKSTGKNSKWRWILFDTDFGFGWIDESNYRHNTLEFALEPNGPAWPNPSSSTLIFRKLIENNTFSEKFIIRFLDLLNSTFSEENVKGRIDLFKNKIKDEIPRHSERWDQFSYNRWEKNIDQLEYFADFRPTFVKQHLKSRFNLLDESEVKINISNLGAGKVIINTITPEKYPFNGKYLNDLNIKLVALPNPGYIFTGWAGSINSSQDTLNTTLNTSINIIANFEKKSDYAHIVINEINYNSASDFDTEDWIELYNDSGYDQDLSNWVLSDEDDQNIFTIPQNSIIAANDYLIVCRDTNSFKSKWGSGLNLIGNLDFSFGNSGDFIRLFTNIQTIIDSVRYKDIYPWSEEADGTGNTLELKNPSLDNSVAGSWQNSTGYGTPGLQNSSFVVSVDEFENEIIKNEFYLSQNYPNPFNPVTTIKYEIQEQVRNGNNVVNLSRSEESVKLIVYDILGRKVKTLVNKQQAPGNYEIIFDAANLNSGVYFYQLKAGNFTASRKMLLIK